MVGESPDPSQKTFLAADLRELLDPHDPLRRLAEKIPWGQIETMLAPRFSKNGRPSKPIRMMVGLLILKHMEDLSDEVVVDRWRQNPYYQYFCGETVFCWKFPCHPTELVHFRKRIGKEGVESILKVSIEIQGRKESDSTTVILDTTAQEKNIQAPHDSKLYRRIAETMVRVARREGILLDRTYAREIKALLRDLRTRNFPRARRKAVKATRRLRTIAGRLYREMSRKMDESQRLAYESLLATAEKILAQERHDSGKSYSLHEPQCYAMARGKDQKMWEFGTKVSLALNRQGVIVGAMNLDKNRYDGHTVAEAVAQVERLTGRAVRTVVGDLGYRNPTRHGDELVITPADMIKRSNDWLLRRLAKRLCRWRPKIEPIIGHLKQEHRLGRNFLKGWLGDEINVMLAAAGFNFRKLLRKIFGLISALWILATTGINVHLRTSEHRRWRALPA